ncbi:hypothetical protein OC842_000485 [Tilletia horrida]|uniref:Late embryogenesis abundant protein LEA-2 subgroup domain-containing protein n=1 Tax=Tilletia horrida TaxID=155126 RepID=A0AAN6JU37_9BASI|nr:hypothetical protein OC842_000485 [Tilletia horrida]
MVSAAAAPAAPPAGAAGSDYAFRSPYSQASHDEHRFAQQQQQQPQPTEYGASRAQQHDTDVDDDEEELEPPTKERAELYSNTLNNAGAEHDYPTRSALGGAGAGGATARMSKSYADVGGAGDGSAAYGRKGIWTHADRSAFQQRSTGVKILRSVCCVLLIGIIFVLSAVLLIITFARPPNVAIGAITSNQTIPTLGRTSLSFNMSVDITVSNPNAIAATITELDAVAYDQVRPATPIGTGRITDVRIDTKANTTFTLPFVVSYDSTTDGDSTLIRDIATKCGWLSGTSPSQLDFTFKINAHLSVLSLAIPFSFSVSPTFTCPISASAISGLLGSTGGSLDEILKALGIGGGSRRGLDGEFSVGERNLPLLRAADGHELTVRDIQFANLLGQWRERASLGTAAQARSEL